MGGERRPETVRKDHGLTWAGKKPWLHESKGRVGEASAVPCGKDARKEIEQTRAWSKR